MRTIIITTQKQLDKYMESKEYTILEIRAKEMIVVRKTYNNSIVEAWGNSTVKACGNSTVKAYDNSTVSAYNNSIVEAWGNSTVEACGNSTVKAWDNSTTSIHSYSSDAKITLDGYSVCWNKCKSKNIKKKSKTSVIIKVD